MQNDSSTHQLLKEEYLDASANMRAYGNMRFAQLTLYVAITAGLLKLLFTSGPQITCATSRIVALGGCLATIAFGVMEERSSDYWHHFRRRAVDLERELGYKQHTAAPSRKVISATNAVRMLYIIMLAFWTTLVILGIA
jgi:hypothetical protein